MSFTPINLSSSSLTLGPRRRTEVGGQWKLRSSEDAVWEGTGNDNGMQTPSPASQMRWQLQQHSDMQPNAPCSTGKFCRCCAERHTDIQLQWDARLLGHGEEGPDARPWQTLVPQVRQIAAVENTWFITFLCKNPLCQEEIREKMQTEMLLCIRGHCGCSWQVTHVIE